MNHRQLGEVTLYIGGLHVSSVPVVVKTVLGSCIAVCLHDPDARIGGMNHFMLPAPSASEPAGVPSRFGVHAMDLLLDGIRELGGDRRRLQAKIFGGGHVLGTENRIGVPQRNIRFILSYMDEERIPVVGQDLGGHQARRVHFFTESGRALVKRLGEGSLRVLRPDEAQEAARQQEVGALLLFDEAQQGRGEEPG